MRIVIISRYLRVKLLSSEAVGEVISGDAFVLMRENVAGRMSATFGKDKFVEG